VVVIAGARLAGGGRGGDGKRSGEGAGGGADAVAAVDPCFERIGETVDDVAIHSDSLS
jgi:hypothetical protein